MKNSRPINDIIKEALSYSMGAELHEAWRETRKKEDGTYEPRMKKSKDEKWNEKHGTDEVDIANLCFEELPSDWQYEILEAAKVAIDQVFEKVAHKKEINTQMIEEMASVVHDEWLKRNDYVFDKEKGNPDQAKPYKELSEKEKTKDRIQIEQAIKKVQEFFDIRSNINISDLIKKYGIDVYTDEPIEEKEDVSEDRGLMESEIIESAKERHNLTQEISAIDQLIARLESKPMEHSDEQNEQDKREELE